MQPLSERIMHFSGGPGGVFVPPPPHFLPYMYSVGPPCHPSRPVASSVIVSPSVPQKTTGSGLWQPYSQPSPSSSIVVERDGVFERSKDSDSGSEKGISRTSSVADVE